MKKSFIIIFVLLAVSLSSWGQSSNVVDKTDYFLTASQLPDASKFLPPYPEDGSQMFRMDSCVYEAGKAIRASERGLLAIEDAETSIRYVMKRFSPAVGKELTPEAYPVLADFLYRSYTTSRLSITAAKDKFHRKRPYQYFGEHTPLPEREAPDDYTSYPSGHTIRFWMAALTLVTIDPEHQDEILKVGYDLGQSRTIVGFHYQTDIDAARMVAGAAFARISIDPKWQKCRKKALREFNRNK